jgi:peptide/nickel transport system permease protein
VVVVVGVTIFTFLLEHLIPGNIARAVIGPRATVQQVKFFDQEYGLNRPLPVQYFSFLKQLLHGNLGYSYKQNRSVDSIISEYLPRDILLVGSSIIFALLIAIPLGILQAVKRNRPADFIGTAIALTLYSMPAYLFSLLLIDAFSIQFHIFPPSAPQASTVFGILADPMGLILPIGALTLITCALFSRYMRSSAISSLTQDYIRTARSKGLSENTIRLRHVLRNSLIPIATMVGLSLPSVLTAGLIVEYVFNFQGLGLAYYNAALSSDYPVEIGITVLIGFAVVLGNLLADLAYAVLDPRVRLGASL